MEVALLYNPNDKGIHGNHWKRNNYRFFQEELPKQVSLTTYPILGGFDCRQIKADAVILWSIRDHNLAPMELKGFKELDCLKITRAPDAWQIDNGYNKTAKELGIDLIVSFQSPRCQYDYLDSGLVYKRFILGIDMVTYKCLDNWDSRRSDKILSSGVLPSYRNQGRWFYYFRRQCTESQYVEHVNKPSTNEVEHKFLGTDYWRLLTQYRAAIACMSYTSVLKYFEIPMCGCLMFAEVNDFNQIEELGFEDGVNCIYINKDDYRLKFRWFLVDPDNPDFKRIADAGRQLVLDRYTNEREVKRFVQTIESMAAAKSQ